MPKMDEEDSTGEMEFSPVGQKLGGKRKNIEKRREKSRTAARSRRNRESDIFTDLYDVVPLVHEPTVSHVDRIAVLRLAASLCKIRKVAPKVLEEELKADQDDVIMDGMDSDLCKLWTEQSVSTCLDGFLIVADSEETILYISEGVSATLGLTQTDIIGQKLEDVIHVDDLEEFKQKMKEDLPGFDPESSEKSQKLRATQTKRIILRVKSVLSPRGRNLNLKSATYKAVTFSVKILGSEQNGSSDFIYTLHGTPVYSTHQQQQEGVQTGMFMTRHTSDMKFSYSQDKITDYLGYEVKSLMGSSFYALVHPQDLQQLAKTLKELFKKGQCRTGYYRLLAKNGGIVWIETEATTLTHSTRGQRGQYVVCLHSVIGSFRSDEVVSDVQLWNVCGGRKSRSPKHHLSQSRVSPNGGQGGRGAFLGTGKGTQVGLRRLAGPVEIGADTETKTKRQRNSDEDITERSANPNTEEAIKIGPGTGNDENFDFNTRGHQTADPFGSGFGFDLSDGPESIRRWLIGDYKPPEDGGRVSSSHTNKTDSQSGSGSGTVVGKLFRSDPCGNSTSIGWREGETVASVGGVLSGERKHDSRAAKNDPPLKTVGSRGCGPTDRLAALSIGSPSESARDQGTPGFTFVNRDTNHTFNQSGSTATLASAEPNPVSDSGLTWNPAGAGIAAARTDFGSSGPGTTPDSGVFALGSSEAGARPGDRGGSPGTQQLGSLLSIYPTVGEETSVTTGLADAISNSNGQMSAGNLGTILDSMFAPYNRDFLTSNSMTNFHTWRNHSELTLTSAGSSATTLEDIDLGVVCPSGSESLAPFVSSDELFDLDALALAPLPLDLDDCQISLDDFTDTIKGTSAFPMGMNDAPEIICTNPMEVTESNKPPLVIIKEEPDLYRANSSCTNGPIHNAPQPQQLDNQPHQQQPVLQPLLRVQPEPQAAVQPQIPLAAGFQHEDPTDNVHPPDPGGPTTMSRRTESAPQRLTHYPQAVARPQVLQRIRAHSGVQNLQRQAQMRNTTAQIQPNRWQGRVPPTPIRVGPSTAPRQPKKEIPLSVTGYQAVMAYMTPYYANAGQQQGLGFTASTSQTRMGLTSTSQALGQVGWYQLGQVGHTPQRLGRQIW